ncbi:MAG: alpha/beta hydrolase, partial [Cyclobacteriaceae bacterium]
KGNGFYRKRFLKKLAVKLTAKAAQFPGRLDVSDIQKIKHFSQLDLKYSAPMNGFSSAEDFYSYASAENYLEAISVPALIVNAKNDPMLPEACFPVALAQKHPYIFLEMPEKGGHVGFYRFGDRYSWAEKRALRFANEYVTG